MVLLIAVAWALMTAGLAVLPGVFGNIVDEPWSVVIAWALVSLVWVPVEVVMRGRLGPLARFAVTAPLWVAAAACGYWLRQLLGLP